jgi:hypothetical protein
MPNDWRIERARLAALTRSRPSDDPELIEARRRFRATRLADHVTKALAECPPMSQEQRHAVARLLIGTTQSCVAGDTDG